jgi:hypothetical protein
MLTRKVTITLAADNMSAGNITRISNAIHKLLWPDLLVNFCFIEVCYEIIDLFVSERGVKRKKVT